jgi:hypothetical protein
MKLYQKLFENNLTTSQRDFSARYLCMNPSYLAQRRDAAVSERALINCFQQLWHEHRYILAARVALIVLWDRPCT